ncbi:MAG TPA: cytochrome c oxidase subunit II [Candidatus Baltobacteraceae bacterium]|nr:cytochrome c oxidase subunit II [Candidatus Baltobacteraceae bacterium]
MRPLLASCLVLCTAGCGIYALPAGATTQAQVLHQDWTVFTLVGLLVAAIVSGLIVFPLLAWRRRRDDYPPQFRQNTKLELIYTIIPLLMVVGLFAVTYRDEVIVEHLSARPANTVDVLAFQWSWRFHYAGTAINIVGTPNAPPQLVLPVDETTRINLTSSDVNHEFWVPAFLFKRDAIAGVKNSFDLRPIRVGLYRGRCAEFCGFDHALMTFTVRVVSQAAYGRWLHAGGK